MKSYVSMEQQVCLVCGQKFDTGSILLDLRMQDTFEMTTVTGSGLCPEHEKLHEDGYVAIIEIDPSRSDGPPYKPESVYRTGGVVHMRREAFGRVFDIPVPEGPIVFAEQGIIERLTSMQNNEPSGS